MTTIDIAISGIWVGLQIAMLYYQGAALLTTRRALAMLARDGSERYRVGFERYRAQCWRLSAIIANLFVGIIALSGETGLRLFFIVALVYGEIVLLRNTYADLRLIRRLAEFGDGGASAS